MSFTDEEVAYIRSQLQQVMEVTPGISWSVNLSGRPLSDRRGQVAPHRTAHQGGSA